MKNKKLHPFGEKEHYSINFKYKILDKKILFNFLIQGELKNIHFQPYSQQIRRDNLWQDTCFELFFGKKDSNEYFEINCSPTGNWASYHFYEYRKKKCDSAYFFTHILSDDKSMQIEVSKSFFREENINKINPAVILKLKKNQLLYLAINHPKNNPDFHNREEWINFSLKE